MQRFLESTGATKRTSTVLKGRIASEADREYVLIKNDDVAGGWTMGIKSKKEDPNAGTKETPVKLDSSDEDEEFEEVEVPGISQTSTPKLSSMDVPFFHSSLIPTPKTQTDHLVNDMGSYVDDNESIENVMERFKKLEEANSSTESNEVAISTSGLFDIGETKQNTLQKEYLEKPPDPALFVNDEQVYDYWINQVPPEFKFIFPLYEIILKEAVYDFSEAARDSIILSFSRKLEKTSEDNVSQDKVIAYTFYIVFCRFVNEWKKMWQQIDIKEEDTSENTPNVLASDPDSIETIQSGSPSKEQLQTHTPTKKKHTSVSHNENSGTRFASQFESCYELHTSDTEGDMFFEEVSFSLSNENHSPNLMDKQTTTPTVNENDLEELYNIDFSSSFLQPSLTSKQEKSSNLLNTTPESKFAISDDLNTSLQSGFTKTSKIESKFFKLSSTNKSKATEVKEEPSSQSSFDRQTVQIIEDKNESDILLDSVKSNVETSNPVLEDLSQKIEFSKSESPSESSCSAALDLRDHESSEKTFSSEVVSKNDEADVLKSNKLQPPLEDIQPASSPSELPLEGAYDLVESIPQATSAFETNPSQDPTALPIKENPIHIRESSPPMETEFKTASKDSESPKEARIVSTPIKARSNLSPKFTTPVFTRSQTEYSSGRSEQPLYISPETIKIISSGGATVSKRSIIDHHSQTSVSPTKSRRITDEPKTSTSAIELFDSDDEDVATHLDEENSEFAQFVSALKNKDIETVHRELESEVKDLNMQMRKDQRDVSNPSNNMISDIQDLLRLFGIPYVVAPMEAEAQCAELLKLSLVDGIVTDDSDVFLFGGTKIYRNMFNQSKFVECYQSSDLEREMKLDQDKLISLAYLLGSDYTEGVTGVGVVNAMEILNEWSGEEGLRRFKEWWNDLSNVSKDPPIRKKLRNILKKCYIPSSFPDLRVREAYVNPMVDDSDQKFQWGIPDLDGLRGYMQDKLRWPESKTDETLIPIIRNINQRKLVGNQTTLDGFLGPSPERTATHKSARIRDIVSKWVHGSQDTEPSTSPTKHSLDSDSTPDGSEDEAEVVPVSEPVKSRGRGRGRGRARGKRGNSKSRMTTTRGGKK
ncbi:DNA repair protein rad2 [Basidiobolus ranarum]|uniref:DNA repair protein rad2 n=1 Tax=Basidiobolus ranarum TaxID=34480 RepID=A0ABR2W2Z9_9FUNG